MSMESRVSPSMKRYLLPLSCILLALGASGGPLISRLYFIHGGKLLWFTAFLQNIGNICIPIFLVTASFFRSDGPTKSKFFHIKLPLFLASSVIGVFCGFGGYLYGYGISHLPLSTSALISSSQLAFTAIFAFILVKQKFTSFSVNAIVLLTMGASVLALHTSSDRPEGESNKEYVIGFLMTLAAAALFGLVFPLVELTYIKSNQAMTCTLLVEYQMIMGLFAAICCFVGMIINNDLIAIPDEALDFGLGETRYYVVIVFCSFFWLCFSVGAIGVVFCASSLLSGVIMVVMLPVTEVLAVTFYRENFKVEKGLALVLSLWGFVSYFYGEFQQSKKKNKKLLQEGKPELELPLAVN